MLDGDLEKTLIGFYEESVIEGPAKGKITPLAVVWWITPQLLKAGKGSPKKLKFLNLSLLAVILFLLDVSLKISILNFS